MTARELIIMEGMHVIAYCPHCHSTHFGSSQNSDRTMTRQCHDGCGKSWHDSEDDTHFYLRVDDVLKLLGEEKDEGV